MQECPTKPLNVNTATMRTDVDTNDPHSNHSDLGSSDESDDVNLNDQSAFDALDAEDVKSETEENGFSDTNSPSSTQGGSKESKLARVENISTSLQSVPQNNKSDIGYSDMRQPKRKRYFPQQHEGISPKSRRVDNNLEGELWRLRHQPHTVENNFKQYDRRVPKPSQFHDYPCNASTSRQPFEFHSGNAAVPRPEQEGKHKFSNTGTEETNEQNDRLVPAQCPEKDSKELFRNMSGIGDKELQQIIVCLKSNIVASVTAVVDTELSKFFQKRNFKKREDSTAITTPKDQSPSKEGSKPFTQDKNQTTTTDHSLNYIQQMPDLPSSNRSRRPGRHSAFELPKLGSPEMPRTLFSPPLSYYPQSQMYPPPYSCAVPPEQTQALSLVANKPMKTRLNVTDTILPPCPSAVRASLPDNTSSMFSNWAPYPVSSLIAMLATGLPKRDTTPKPSLQHSDISSFYKQRTLNQSPMKSERYMSSSTHSPSDTFMKSDYDDNCHSFDSQGKPGPGNTFRATDRYRTDTLTQMHLRKAKLMFFYARYPSHAVLKIYFPDIIFNIDNKAQLVKWFSNFREFFYMKIERYAIKAIAEGFERADEMDVTSESELFRIIKFHYNINDRIEVPEKFRLLVQNTLREFYMALKSNKDAKPWWKKSIYKVVARMDDELPEYFKSPNFMEQLSDVGMTSISCRQRELKKATFVCFNSLNVRQRKRTFEGILEGKSLVILWQD